MDTVLANARIVLADRIVEGAVALRDGRIRAVDPGPVGEAVGAEDLEGDLLLPGLVELHTDHLERHFQPRPGVVWPADAAVIAHDAQIVASGITTVFDAISVGEYAKGGVRRRILDESVRAIGEAHASGALRADHRLHMRLEIADPAVVPMFEPLAGHPLVGLASVMDHTPGQRQWRDKAKHKAFVQGRNGWNEDETEAWFASRVENQRQWAAPNRAALLALCAENGLLVASHDDTTPEHVAEAVADGISISEFPTTPEAARAAREHGMGIVMGAPNVVRGGSHSGNASAGELAAVGLLDALASDYVPASLLHGALMLHGALGLPLPEAVATVTRNPARLARLDDRGEIAPGLRADLVRVRLMGDVPVVRAVWREGGRVF